MFKEMNNEEMMKVDGGFVGFDQLIRIYVPDDYDERYYIDRNPTA